jgi:EmrB/QacA subfamily drug resistance transporter
MIHMTYRELRTSPNARWIALVVVCLAQLMSIVDASIVNVALPNIQRSLSFSPSSLTWVVNGYLISFGSFLLLAGRLGDLVGRRRMFLAGVALFTVASAVCGLSDDRTLLIAARFVQGLGGAGATSAIMAIIVTEFRVAAERAKAMSIYMGVVSSGGSIGLLAGGVITQVLNWHWIFFINVPIGIATFLLGRLWITENEGLGIGRDIDIAGPILVTTSMMLTAYTIVSSSSNGWGSLHTLGLLGIALGLLAAFVALEARIANPILPLRIFAIRGIAASSLVRGLLITGMFATFFVGALYFQHARGYDVLQTGLAFLPQTLALAAMSFGVAARLVNRFGARGPLLAGLALSAVGLGWLSQVGATAPYATSVLPPFLLIGVGAGLSFMPLLTIAMEHVPTADAGMASGIVNTSLQLSGALGVAVLGTIASSRTGTLQSHGTDRIGALLGGYQLAFSVAAGCAVAAALLAVLVWVVRPALATRSPSPAAS